MIQKLAQFTVALAQRWNERYSPRPRPMLLWSGVLRPFQSYATRSDFWELRTYREFCTNSDIVSSWGPNVRGQEQNIELVVAVQIMHSKCRSACIPDKKCHKNIVASKILLGRHMWRGNHDTYTSLVTNTTL